MRQLLVPDLALGDGAGDDAVPRVGSTIALPRDVEQRLRRVLRMRDGARLTVSDGAGRRAETELLPDGLCLLSLAPVEPRRRPQLWLAFAPLKGDRGDWLVEKAVEIGVDILVPLRCDHAVAKLDPGRADRQLDRWQALADAALEQCGRPWRARVAAPIRPAALVEAPATAGVPCTWMVADERGGEALERAAIAGVSAVTTAPGVPPSAARDRCSQGQTDEIAVGVVIGPEGGLSAEERSSLLAQGVVPITLGRDVLRAETAALVALARLAAWRATLHVSS